MKDTLETLKTDRPVLSINPSTNRHLNEIGKALRNGVAATPDKDHPGFYEVELGDRWYYLHMSDRAPGVYLVAAENSRNRPCA